MTASAAALPSTFYKMDIQGIVYLVDPATAIAYTYDMADPIPVGQVLWTSPTTPPRIALFEETPALLAAKKMTWPGYYNPLPPHDATPSVSATRASRNPRPTAVGTDATRAPTGAL